MNVEIPEDKIYYYKNVLDNPNSLVNYIEKLDDTLQEKSLLSKWKNWNAYQSEYSFGQQKKFIYSRLSDTSSLLYKECMFIYNEIYNAIILSSEHYKKNQEGLDIGLLAPLSISKYFEGKMMGPHVDAHDNDPTKTISCVLYLNDNYEGGELNFPNHNIMIKPEAGSLIIFPSKYLHESKVIKSGVKYMAPGFWNKHSV